MLEELGFHKFAGFGNFMSKIKLTPSWSRGNKTLKARKPGFGFPEQRRGGFKPGDPTRAVSPRGNESRYRDYQTGNEFNTGI